MNKLTRLLLIALVVAACGGDPADPGTSSTTSTIAAGSTVPTTVAATTTSSMPAETTTTESPTETVGAELLVAGPDGVFLVDAAGTSAKLIEGPAVFAIDDLQGGVLFQQERWSRNRRSIVYRVRAGTGEMIEALVPSSDQGLVLAGIARDGDTYIYYSRNEGTTPEDTRETLRRYSLETRQVIELEVIGGWESGAFPVSISDSLILLNWFSEAVHGMDFIDLRGNAAAVAADPDPEVGFFEDCATCPRLGELSIDGTEIVYHEVIDGAEFAVIRHVASGAEIRRIELGGIDQTYLSFDLSGDHLVVNRGGTDGPLSAWIYDLGQVDPQPVDVGILGEAYLTRSPVSVPGVVPAP